MRRFFSFKSLASSSGNSSDDVKVSNSKHGKVRGSSQSPQDNAYDLRGQHQETEDSSSKHLSRSISFSYPAIYCASGGGNMNSVNEQSVFISSCGNSPHQKAECSNK